MIEVSYIDICPPLLVSGNPEPAEDCNLHFVTNMMQRFGLVTGLSDHTLDNTTAITSVALGASIIEKHFTLDRSGGGPDDSFSLEPAELAQLCHGARTAWQALGRRLASAWQALGKVDYDMKSSEQVNVKFRRSLYFVRNMRAGEIITENSIRSVRPGYGMSPKNYENLIGRKMKQSKIANTPVTNDAIDWKTI